MATLSFWATAFFCTPFIRGDANFDFQLDLSDSIAILDSQFAGKSLACLDAADANDDGVIDLADPIWILAYLFADGPAFPPPFPEPGEDPTEDQLSCAAGEDDAHEPDNRPEQACSQPPLTPGRTEGFCGDDDLWFFSVTEEVTVRLALTFPAGTDLDLYLLTRDLGVISSSVRETGGSEEVERVLPRGEYFAAVRYFRGDPAPYTLNFTITQPCPDDTREEDDSAAQAQAYLLPPQQRITGICRDSDWFALQILEPVKLRAFLRGGRGDIDLALVTENHTLLSLADSRSSDETLSRTLLPGTYFLVVLPFNGACVPYELSWQTGPPCLDSHEDDDFFSQAQEKSFLPAGEKVSAFCDDEDLWAIEISPFPVKLSAQLTPASGDLDLLLLGPTGLILGRSERPGRVPEKVVSHVKGPTLLYLLVLPKEDACVPYELLWQYERSR